MKLCPNCSEQLHKEAHFCPKCLYQFEKVEMDKVVERKVAKQAYRRIGISVAAMTVLIVAVVLGWNLYPRTEKRITPELTYGDIFSQEPEPGVVTSYDMDCGDMFISYQELRLTIGEETEEVQFDDTYEIHTHGALTVGVNGSGNVQYLCLNYSDVSKNDMYGIMGIGCRTSRENTKLLLGMPRQEYGDFEFIYDFYRDEEPYHTYLHIYFDEAGMVEQWEYYYRESL